MPSKITDLTELAVAPDGADLLEIVDDVAGTPTSKKISVANLLGSVDLSLFPKVVASASPSSVAAVDFSFPAGFTSFDLIGWLLPATDNVIVTLVFDDGGGFDVTNEYDITWGVSNSSGTYSDGGSLNTGNIHIARGATNHIGNGSGEGASFRTSIERALIADRTLVSSVHSHFGSGVLIRGQHAGRHNVASVLTAMRVSFSSGDISAGELRLIGIP